MVTCCLNEASDLLSLLRSYFFILFTILGEALHVVFKPEETIADLFGEVITRYMHDDTVTFDTVTFLLNNLQQLCLETELLEKYSPSILRVRRCYYILARNKRWWDGIQIFNK